MPAIHRPRPWDLAREITPEDTWLRRRELLQQGALAAGALAGIALLPGCGSADEGSGHAGTAAAAEPDAAAKPGRYANAPRNAAYSTDEEPTPYDDATGYNNFYEFGSEKEDPSRYAGKMRVSPWSVRVGGDVKKPGEMPLEALLAPHTPEERVYRLRCVEAWSMVIPWVGIPLADVLKRLEPGTRAKFVAFRTLFDPEQMPGQRRTVLDWPYREGLRIDEAMHPLALLAVGMYGRELPNQNGAPLRLVVPWKYGFKSIKSIVSIDLVEEQPQTSWNMATPREYGFYSNVNPEVDHPRWSQKRERRIGEFRRRPTLPFNGYADQVGSLYAGMDLAKFF